MVKDYSKQKEYECSLTHPSIIKPLIDYCIIAGAKKIIIGDAPVAGADFDKICKDYYYNDLVNLYKNVNIDLEIVDLRSVVICDNGRNLELIENEKGEIVEFGENSEFSKLKENWSYEVTFSPKTKECANDFHNLNRHAYYISKVLLSVDFVINICKPKTHKIAGITAAQKNFIGICTNRSVLPHYRYSKKKKGDENNKNNFFMKIRRYWFEKYINSSDMSRTFSKSKVYLYIYMLLDKLKPRNWYGNGQWYGNDTIWRATIDLNKSVVYLDKDGHLDLDKPQRKVLFLADAIICGEKDGPMNPDPKHIGMIMISKYAPLLDFAVSKLIGIDYKKIPTVYYGIQDKLLNPTDINKTKVYSNVEKYNNIYIKDISFEDKYSFKLSPTWKEVVHEQE